MKKCILLTTLSTMNFGPTVNYYRATIRDNVYYCQGVQNQEAASYYALANYNITGIVAIASAEVKKTKTDSTVQAPLTYDEIVVKYKEKMSEASISSEEIFSKFPEWFSVSEIYRIGIHRFMSGDSDILEDQPDTLKAYSDTIAEVRRGRIQDIVKEALQEYIKKEPNKAKSYELTEDNILKECFRITAKDVQDNIESIIRGKLQYDIDGDKRKGSEESEESFKEGEEYKKLLEHYHFEAEDQFEAERFMASFTQLKNAIKTDDKISALEREYQLVILQNMFEQKQDDIKKSVKIVELQEKYVEVLLENESLKREIKTLREIRLKNECMYARYYLYEFLDENHKLWTLVKSKECPKIIFVDDKDENGHDNLNGIVKAIQDETVTEGIELIIDMQGGDRTAGYMRNALIYLLGNQDCYNISIREIIGGEFGNHLGWANEIREETEKYRIMDLVSGMNAFLKYGKADQIKEYIKSMNVPKNSSTYKLVSCMKEIDNAISLCDVNALEQKIKELNNILKSEKKLESNENGKSGENVNAEESRNSNDGHVENSAGTVSVDMIFSLLRNGIEKDYGKLLGNLTFHDLVTQIPQPKLSSDSVKYSSSYSITKCKELKMLSKLVILRGASISSYKIHKVGIDYLELIKWCIRKEFMQQALTIIEVKMPELIWNCFLKGSIIINASNEYCSPGPIDDGKKSFDDLSNDKMLFKKVKGAIGGEKYEKDIIRNIFLYRIDTIQKRCLLKEALQDIKPKLNKKISDELIKEYNLEDDVEWVKHNELLEKYLEKHLEGFERTPEASARMRTVMDKGKLKIFRQFINKGTEDTIICNHNNFNNYLDKKNHEYIWNKRQEWLNSQNDYFTDGNHSNCDECKKCEKYSKQNLLIKIIRAIINNNDSIPNDVSKYAYRFLEKQKKEVDSEAVEFLSDNIIRSIEEYFVGNGSENIFMEETIKSWVDNNQICIDQNKEPWSDIKQNNMLTDFGKLYYIVGLLRILYDDCSIDNEVIQSLENYKKEFSKDDIEGKYNCLLGEQSENMFIEYISMLDRYLNNRPKPEYEKTSLFLDLLHKLNNKEYSYDPNATLVYLCKNDQPVLSKDGITITLNTQKERPDDEYLKKLDNILKLYNALKKSRNHTNHAMYNDLRISYDMTKKMTESIIQMFEDLRDRQELKKDIDNSYQER